jgi:mono/diheme cytochrome c family protein
MNLPMRNPAHLWLLACAISLVVAGCRSAPGKPGPDPETPRPEQLLDFATLYKQNCSACHGENGKNAAAIPLANPAYLAIAGVTNIERITAAGVSDTAMPPFGKAAGGMLTPQQITVLVEGMGQAWGNPSALAGQTPPAYAASTPGNAVQGQKTFATFCARCHGADATGAPAGNGVATGSLIDPSYLALITDQGLRSIILAGQTEQGPHDWRSYLTGPGARPMTDPEVTDTVAWLASHRTATPGQVYKQHP